MKSLLGLYERILLIRRAEEELSRLFADGEIPGFIHLGIGQEAVAAGVGAALGTGDTVASTHRGHGHALAKGMSVESLFLEIMGREEGICRGRGGSMHVADMSVGMLGANGIVGGGLTIALGSAFAHQVKKSGNLAVAFFGDGAMAEGALHETMNLAALWKLPLLFVCENNGWAEFTPSSRQVAVKLCDLAAAFKVPAKQIDGGDVEAVAKTARHLAGAIRKGGGPRVLECMTHRVRGHYEGDPQNYRDPEEMADLARHDPIARCVSRLTALGVGESERAAVGEAIERRIAAAVERARRGAEPRFEGLGDRVYQSVDARAADA